MGFKDISPEIASIAKDYQTHKLPSWILRLQELAQQFAQWLQDMLDYLLRHRGPGAADSKGFSTLLQFGLYLAGLIALAFIAYFLWKRISEKRELQAATRRGAETVEKILDSEGYREEAERLAGTNEYRGACRSLYLSLLQGLHEKSIAGFSPAKTNYEYKYLLASHLQLQKDFMDMALVVEQVWFGNKPAAQEDYLECLRLYGLAADECKNILEEKDRLQGEAKNE